MVFLALRSYQWYGDSDCNANVSVHNEGDGKSDSDADVSEDFDNDGDCNSDCVGDTSDAGNSHSGVRTLMVLVIVVAEVNMIATGEVVEMMISGEWDVDDGEGVTN